MKSKLILPSLYVTSSVVLLGLFTGVGHGWGSYPWFWISLPVSLILLIGDMSTAPTWLTGLINTPAGILVPFVACVFQYWALGVFLDRHRKK